MHVKGDPSSDGLILLDSVECIGVVYYCYFYFLYMHTK